MFADDRRIMRVRVMPVVVTVHMVVLDGLVHVPVAVMLADMEIHAEPEQPGCRDRE